MPRLAKVHGRENISATLVRESKRLTLLSNFGRFLLPRLLPPSVDHVLYLDSDVLAVGGAIESETTAPLKRAFHRAVQTMRQAQRAKRSVSKSRILKGSLRGALGAVPFGCSDEAFVDSFVDRQFLRTADSLAQAAAARQWLRRWASARRGSSDSSRAVPTASRSSLSGSSRADPTASRSSLCFNAGVLLISLDEWRRVALSQRLERLALSRQPRVARVAHLMTAGGAEPPAHALWAVGTQRPLNLLFGGEYVALPSALNVDGCGASRILHTGDLHTAADIARNDVLRQIEFERGGGLLHFTGHYKPWTWRTARGTIVERSKSGMRPCLFAARLFDAYLHLARLALIGRDKAAAPRSAE